MSLINTEVLPFTATAYHNGEFVTVSELLAAGRPVVEPICYDSRPGDTDRYDNFLKKPARKVARAPAPPPAPATVKR